MKTFAYVSAPDVGHSPRSRSPREPQREVPRRRHQPRRPDARGHRAARHGHRHHQAAADRDRGAARRRRADRRARAQQPPGRRTRWSGPAIRCCPRRSSRRLRAAAQHGDGRRQPAAAHPLPLLLRRAPRAATSASPAAAATRSAGFNRNRGVLGAARRCVATHPSDMCVALAALDAIVEVESVRGTRRIPLADFHRLPGATPHLETAAGRRRADHRGRAARPAGRGAAPATARCATGPPTPSPWSRSPRRWTSETAASSDVRLALGGVAHQAVAGVRGGAGPARRAGHRGDLPAGGRGRARAGGRAGRSNEFKIELAQRTIVATLRRLLADGSAA